MDTLESKGAVDDWVVVGKITTAFGIQGWVKIYSFTDNPEDIFSYTPWSVKTARGVKMIKVSKWKIQSKGLVAKLEGCNDRDSALAYGQNEIRIKKSQFQPLQDNEFYWKDLQGCRVINQQQENLGIVQSLMETGANDVLVVKIDHEAVPLQSDKGKDEKQRLIPYVPDEVIQTVDIANKQIVVEWPSDF